MNTQALISLIGLPYEDRGRGPKAFDCYGLFIEASKSLFGIETPDFRDYVASKDFKSVSTCINTHKLDWLEIDFKDRSAGDAIVLTLSAMPIHIGLILDDKKMLHTLPGRNSCIEHYTCGQWTKRIQGVYRWTKLRS